MRVGILDSFTPFSGDSDESLADSLRSALTEFGHEAIVIRLPFRKRPVEGILEQALAFRLISLNGYRSMDRVIALAFPAYLAPHDNKIVWMREQFREAYDPWSSACFENSGTPAGRRLLEAIRHTDREHLGEARKIYATSPAAVERLGQCAGVDPELLYPPLDHPERFFCTEYGDAAISAGPLYSGGRGTLVIEGLRRAKSPVRLVMAGYPSGPERDRLERAVRESGLETRVQWLPRARGAELAAVLAGALCCVHAPQEEDTWGELPRRAYQARKPVITCEDSGGSRILVRHGETGLVAAPTPEAIAAALDQLYEDRQESRRMGETGYALMNTLTTSWKDVVLRLTA